MQKATYYDSSAIYGAYPYQGANGFTYNASQQQYPPSSSLVETEYHRPACSLQSPGSAVSHHKANDISESCMRTLPSQPLQPPGLTDPQAPPQPPPAPQAQPPPPSSASPSQNASSNPAPANSTKSPALNSPTVSKQIFPWMKESRQNTKQKNSSSSSGMEHATFTCPLGSPGHLCFWEGVEGWGLACLPELPPMGLLACSGISVTEQPPGIFLSLAGWIQCDLVSLRLKCACALLHLSHFVGNPPSSKSRQCRAAQAPSQGPVPSTLLAQCC